MTRCLSSPYSKKFGPDSWCSEERAEECEDGHDLTTSCINKTTLIKREMAVTGSLIITYPLLAFAFGFDTDNRLSLGLVHNYSPLISSCQTIKIINVKYVIKVVFFVFFNHVQVEILTHLTPLPSFPSPSDFSSFPSDLQKHPYCQKSLNS